MRADKSRVFCYNSPMYELNYPAVLEPSCRLHVWGRENWVASVRPERPSVVGSGPVKGVALSECSTDFRLLVKVIDADDKLSLQVHPNEETCKVVGGEPKTEMWCMLKDGTIYAGFKDGVGPGEVAEAVAAGTLEELLVRHEAKAGDVFLVPGGLVHSIGGGARVYEVQQSSDTTFRLYDWDRKNDAGELRDLHVDKALKAIDYSLRPPVASKSAECAHFSFRQFLLDGSMALAASGRSTLLFAARGGFSVGALTVEEGASVLVPPGSEVELAGAGSLVFATKEG